jgi:Fe-S oxidoreductase
LRKARKLAIDNVNLFAPIITDECPLIGIEPSAILAFRDEYPNLVGQNLKDKAKLLARRVYLFDEFIDREIKRGKITSASFTKQVRTIKVHGHCQQKAVASVLPTLNILALPENYRVSEIKSGCCGMAGSFGYEKEHYELSMKVGELVLFPEVRNSDTDTIIVAAGTSCRHQIFDGTARKALHPAEVLFDALI